MKKLLVPTDFSPNAAKAMDYAAELASASGASLMLVSVSVTLDVPFRDKTALELKYGFPDEQAMQAELNALTEKYRAMGITVRNKLYSGSVTSAIIEAARENHADLIVMGTLGDASFKEKLFGSITSAIIGKSKIPVLAIPLLADWNPIKHLMIAVSQFKIDPSVLKPAFDLARAFGATTTLSVFTDDVHAEVTDLLDHSRGLMEYETKCKQLFPTFNLQTGKIFGRDFETALDLFIEEQYVDVLVMVTHASSTSESFFHRSKTRKMSYHTNIPLLSIPV